MRGLESKLWKESKDGVIEVKEMRGDGTGGRKTNLRYTYCSICLRNDNSISRKIKWSCLWCSKEKQTPVVVKYRFPNPYVYSQKEKFVVPQSRTESRREE